MFVLLFAVIAISFYWDIRKRIIPNAVTVPAMGVGIAYHTVLSGWSGMLFAFFGFAAGFGVAYLLYALRAIGAGDVKLFGAIGTICGAPFALDSLLRSVLFAGGIGLIVLLCRSGIANILRISAWGVVRIVILRDLRLLTKPSTDKMTTVPFMLAVLPGVITAWLSR